MCLLCSKPVGKLKSRPSIIGFVLFVQRTCDDDDDDDDDGQLLHSSFAFTAYMPTAAHDKDAVALVRVCERSVHILQCIQ